MRIPSRRPSCFSGMRSGVVLVQKITKHSGRWDCQGCSEVAAAARNEHADTNSASNWAWAKVLRSDRKIVLVVESSTGWTRDLESTEARPDGCIPQAGPPRQEMGKERMTTLAISM